MKTSLICGLVKVKKKKIENKNFFQMIEDLLKLLSMEFESL